MRQPAILSLSSCPFDIVTSRFHLSRVPERKGNHFRDVNLFPSAFSLSCLWFHIQINVTLLERWTTTRHPNGASNSSNVGGVVAHSQRAIIDRPPPPVPFLAGPNGRERYKLCSVESSNTPMFGQDNHASNSLPFYDEPWSLSLSLSLASGSKAPQIRHQRFSNSVRFRHQMKRNGRRKIKKI